MLLTRKRPNVGLNYSLTRFGVNNDLNDDPMTMEEFKQTWNELIEMGLLVRFEQEPGDPKPPYLPREIAIARGYTEGPGGIWRRMRQ
jgi:hypothetical protein